MVKNKFCGKNDGKWEILCDKLHGFCVKG